jgi:lysophospholipase L1-like esterase
MVSFRFWLAAAGAAVLALATTTSAVAVPTGDGSAGSTDSSTSTSAAQPALQVLTIGDSIMNGHALDPSQAWPDLLAAQDGWTLTNFGCDGAGVIAIGGGKCSSDYSGIISSVAGTHPDIVIFEGSSNDFGQDNTELLQDTVADLKAVKLEFPSAEIVGLSTLWGSTAPPEQLAQVNAQVKEAVAEVGGTYLDIGQPMQGHPELMQADDVHPNVAGQVVLATTIQSALQKVIAKAIANQHVESVRVSTVQDLVSHGLVQ